ncbi:hypothetical protein FRC03_002727 [Tulasnella sp. 419]|nr:hypothetical protein FRC03_002727 [Tulasnella sp. 419]
MLGFLCNGRYHVDDDEQSITYDQSPSTSPRKNRLEKKKITKLVIGTPTDFKHNGHMGYDELSNPQVWGDVEKDIVLRLPDTSTSPRSTALSLPSPTSTEPFGSLTNTANSSVRRKPAPQVAGSIRSQASVSYSTDYPGQYTATGSARSRRPSASQEPHNPQLIPTMGTNTSRNGPESHYATQAAKMRWDGNMAEIDQAVKDSNYRNSLPSRPARI